MISITTHQKQLELRINFSFAGFEKAWGFAERTLSFEQIREVERQKLKLMHEAGFNFWRCNQPA